MASLVLASCGGKDAEKKADDRPTSQPTEGGTQLAAVWPLTGLPAPETTPNHPVMIVKIDNTAASDPQYGLGKADMVVEELVEGGITRLAAMFYSKLPAKAGPVRSARASDIGVVTPTHARPGRERDGAAHGPAPECRARAVLHHGCAGRGPRTPTASMTTLHSVFVDLPKLASSLKKTPVVPANYLPWGAESDFAGAAARPRTFDVEFSSGHHDVGSATTLEQEVREHRHLRRGRVTSSRPTRCWCCGCVRATPATATLRATRCRRRCSSARAS